MSILVGTGRYWWIVVGPGVFGWHTAFGTSPFAPDIHSPIRRLGGCWEDAAGEVTGGIVMVRRAGERATDARHVVMEHSRSRHCNAGPN